MCLVTKHETTLFNHLLEWSSFSYLNLENNKKAQVMYVIVGEY